MLGHKRYPRASTSMADTRIQRRLAAVLAADIVGYSRLMGEDEPGTLAMVKARRAELLEPLVARHHGRIFKFLGDGVLIEFGSAVNAVECAIALQQGMAESNAGITPDRHLILRIGINLGDVMIEASDLYGEGVNIAARLEGIAEPGAILVSGPVYDFVRSKVKASFEDLGLHALKNIAEPARVYRILDTPGVRAPQSRKERDRPSIAVLPFANMSGDPEQAYFSDGITEDIITELARFRALSVIARNSSFRYRGDDIDIARVGRELNVHYVLEGSVRKIGSRIRITAQLIDAESGSHLWADRFDRGADEIFDVQDQVVKMIVGTLAGRLEAAVVDKALRKPPSNLAAYDLVLKADALPVSNPEAQVEARRLSEKAVELDPTYARAYVQLAVSHYVEWVSDFSGSNAALERAFALANDAIRLDENDSFACSVLGMIHVKRRSYDLAEHCYQKALALNPNRAVVMTLQGVLIGCLGRPEEGIAIYQQAKQIDQFFNPTWYWPLLGVLHFMAGRSEEAITYLTRAPTTTPSFTKAPEGAQDPSSEAPQARSRMPFWVHAWLAASCASLDRMEEARQHVAEVLQQVPQCSIRGFLEKEPYKNEADRRRLADALRKAGLPEGAGVR